MTDNPRHFCATPVPPNKVLPPAQAYNPLAAFLRASLWNAGDTIRIRFIDGSPTLRDRVKAVASEWLEHANLTFAFVESGDAHIRIAFIQGDGSWSYVGTDCNQIPADEPTMNYGWLTDDSPDDEVRQVVLHEFGHAIGMIHEHQNPEGGIRWNRDAVIADLSGPPNYWNDQTIENNMFKKYEEAELVLSKLDKTSIMMYPIPASWTEGGYFSAGLNNDLSATDKAMAKEAYPN